MAIWVVLLALLIDAAAGSVQVTVGIAGAALLAALLLVESVRAGRRARMGMSRQGMGAAGALPGWLASPLLARPTPERMRRCAGLPAGGGIGHDEHVDSRHVA